MKFIAFWDVCDFDRAIEKSISFQMEREKAPDRFPKILYPPQFYAGSRGFTIVEVEREEQIANVVAHYVPEMSVKYFPLVDAQTLIELRVRH
jgi:hypothetical protein